MGIRIHKSIGYGIMDFKGKKDSRFTTTIFGDMWQDENPTVGDLFEWSEKNIEAIAEASKIDFDRGIENLSTKEKVKFYLTPYSKEDLKKRLKDFVIYDEECGKKNVMLFQPFNSSHWSRYDNIIDYVESGKEPINRASVLKNAWSGIWPYSGGMVRFRGTPTIFNKSEVYLSGKMDASTYSMLTGQWARKIKPYASKAMLKDLKQNWRCRIPTEITAMLLYFGLVKDVKTFINDLKPMVYTYWG